MSEDQEATEVQEEQRSPVGQVFFDNIFALFLISLVISFLIYNLWGMMELIRLPVSP